MGHEGQKLRVFHLEAEVWQRLWSVLERRQARRPMREKSEGVGSPPSSNNSKPGGDPTQSIPPDLETWFALESLMDVRQMWELGDRGVRADLARGVLQVVLSPLGLAG